MLESLHNLGLSSETEKLLLSSCSQASKTQYDSYLRRWKVFCSSKNIEPMSSNIANVLDFFTSLYKSNLGYSAINTSRSALSLLLPPIDGFTIGTHPLVKRALKAIGKMKPPRPRYTSTWDVNDVLDVFRKWSNNSDLSIKFLTLKMVGLLALVSAQRVQTLKAINVSSIRISGNVINIFISANIKTSKPGGQQPCILLTKYPHEVKLCVVNTITEYLSRTRVYRQHDQLLLSLESPYNAVTSQTISRWLKLLLKEANIDVSMYKAHSFRHASTSKVYQQGVSADIIFSVAGWTANSKTFANFYNKPIDTRSSFANNVLQTK